MKIHLDIGHPAHVHYFRNFMKIMIEKGHSFSITARDKEVTFNLLEKYQIPYTSRGKGMTGLLGKFLYIFQGDWILLKSAIKFKPDIFISFGSTYAAHAAFIYGKPHVTFDDTEHAVLEHLMCFPFTSAILTPNSYLKDLGRKQLRFNGFIELCSLHPKYFNLDASVIDAMNLAPGEKFVLLRFISWQASHDFGIKGISYETKMALIEELGKQYRIFISSESELPEELKKYKLPVPPEKIHNVLKLASLYIGEGATMASECAMLGTPAIYVNELDAGTLREQSDYGLLLNLRNSDKLLDTVKELIGKDNLNEIWQERLEKMLAEKIDVTAFMVWFIENYPNSFRILSENPDYQYNFK